MLLSVTSGKILVNLHEKNSILSIDDMRSI
jgi:hypothetical protein